MPGKLGLTTTQRMAVLKNQASYLLWYGRIETTAGKAKQLKSYAEKLITVAVRNYEDTVKVTKNKIDKKGNETTVEVINDGPKKLAARRKLMSSLYDLQEVRKEKESTGAYKLRIKDVKHPLIEKLFNEIAPKYAKRERELNQGGGYTRIILNGTRRGDAAEVAIIELI